MMAKAFRRSRFLGALAATLLACSLLHADPARFDLAGPKVDVHVTRSGKVLPIAQVPNLQPGDKIWLRADLPPTQSVHYLLVAAFLRGTTNPPPDNWFFEIQTWNKKVREEGVTITVPTEAQQVILFLAPETGGDFSTLRSAVRGRPGIFVRASQDLIEAGFEQARIEAYLAAIRRVPPEDSKGLAEHSDLLSRTLNLKPNGDCFKRPVDMQAACLTQAGNQSLLDDGHGQTVADALSSGANSDFIAQASYTQLAGAGTYSAYVGAIVDLIRITSSLHTAKYQYIPAIAFPDGDALNLRLNTPPSFNNPKSVIVIGLPAIQASVPPPLRASSPDSVSCLLKPAVVLPVEGAPLVYATTLAHDLVLHIDGPNGGTDIPVKPDAFEGGLVLSHAPARKPLSLESNPYANSDPVQNVSSNATPESQPAVAASAPAAHQTTNTDTGTITGFWGFDAFKGPTLQLQDTPGKDWKLADDDVLIAGRENHLMLSSTGTACVDTISLDTSAGKLVETKWKPTGKPAAVDVTVSLKSINPGALHLAIKQFGDTKASTVAAKTYSEPARLASLELHAGDTTADLTGSSLDQVQQLTINDLTFTPAPPSTPSNQDTATPTPAPPNSDTQLRLTLPPNSQAPKLRVGDHLTASLSLKDGRTLTLPVTVSPPRPSVTLISKNIGQSSTTPIHLADQDDLPADQQLTFSLKSVVPFPRSGKIEIANADESLHTTLSVSSGNLVLQNPHTILATLDPLKDFGASAFGPLRLRPVSPDGTTGDWLPLVTLVRLPTFKDLHCPADTTQPCTVTGSSLYLVDSIATDVAFTSPITVPEGFVGTALTLPRPAKTGFFLRLRDDPTSANTVILPILPQAAPTAAPNSPTASASPKSPLRN
ncbi:hypothetical protein [Tunturiibacter gelidoferens]|uniref:Uncharacterized protein n=1 Tax=Tunturiibacter lichenicola TaxID=2051959 RepID=A0A7Y9T390_9BACT|nr:hypothetical protein [Edaphobacter lichenicola]NYF52573.1 hypothetical protein [Edaphobacter lichenicola]